MRQLGPDSFAAGQVCPCRAAPGILIALRLGCCAEEVKRDKSYAKATHNTWAGCCQTRPQKAMTGNPCGMVIHPRCVEREGLKDH